MVFGLRNAPGTFQRATIVILAPVRWQDALLFPDDVDKFSKPVYEVAIYVKQVLTLLKKGVTLKPKKCCFITNTIDCLWNKLWPQRLESDRRTIDTIKHLRDLRNVLELRSLLGLFNFFRRFVSIMAQFTVLHPRNLQQH